MGLKKNHMFKQHLQCPYCREAITFLLNTDNEGFTEIVQNCKKCDKPVEIAYCVQDNKLISLSYDTIEEKEF